MGDVQDNELGDFLRSRRAQLNPKAVGLPVSGRRRTEGLRREEVAQLAGIGVDWYIRLEQGRAVSASTATIDALARALRLSKIEHAHMRALSARSARRPFEREIVPETIRRVIEGLNKPAYVAAPFPPCRSSPPLVAFFPDRQSKTWPRIRATSRFCVNVLGDHLEVGARCYPE